MKKFAYGIGRICFSFLLALITYSIFIVLPLSLVNNAECLRLGYPKSNVTIGLDRYCSNHCIAVPIHKAREQDK
jgi:hypothetical protein